MRKTDSRCSALAGQDPSHTSQVAMTAATNCGFKILPHPQYPPDMEEDMALSDFYLFRKLKSYLRGTQYGSNEGIIEAVSTWRTRKRPIWKGPGIRKLQQRWAKSIALKGDYIEKYWLNSHFLVA